MAPDDRGGPGRDLEPGRRPGFSRILYTVVRWGARATEDPLDDVAQTIGPPYPSGPGGCPRPSRTTS